MPHSVQDGLQLQHKTYYRNYVLVPQLWLSLLLKNHRLRIPSYNQNSGTLCQYLRYFLEIKYLSIYLSSINLVGLLRLRNTIITGPNKLYKIDKVLSQIEILHQTSIIYANYRIVSCMQRNSGKQNITSVLCNERHWIYC